MISTNYQNLVSVLSASAYAVLLYLVKCIAILPPAQALRLKWNRTFSVSGAPGHNIPLDLQKEHDNKDIKCLRQNLGANLDEQNAERTAGTLQSRQHVYYSVDRDCMFNKKHSARRTPKELEAVHQIIIDLVSNKVFTKNTGREGYVSFLFSLAFHTLSDYRKIFNCLILHTITRL